MRNLKSRPPLPLIGAHMSIEGGVDKAVERAASVSCACFQMFTASNNRWQGKTPELPAIQRFKSLCDEFGISIAVSHNSYLHNLASPDTGLYEKSIAGMFEELKRCDAIGVSRLVIHPGAATGGTRSAGIRRIVRAVRKLIRQSRQSNVRICFETTAGQGTVIGNSFSEIAALIEGVDIPDRTGVCLDTCHVFAAGMDFSTYDKYRNMMVQFDAAIGLGFLEVIHLNDSKYPIGMKKDRHEHIGKGHIGKLPFGFFLNDPRLLNVPKILETPKGKDLKEDVMNLSALRSLVE